MGGRAIPKDDGDMTLLGLDTAHQVPELPGTPEAVPWS